MAHSSARGGLGLAGPAAGRPGPLRARLGPCAVPVPRVTREGALCRGVLPYSRAVVELEAPLALPLRPRYRHVRLAPDASRRALARERDPHAGGQAHVLLTGPEGWRGHASREPFGHVGDLLGADH